jgi:argininosuccinate lyase
VGQLVLAAEREGRQLSRVSEETRRRISPELAGSLDELVDPRQSVQRKRSVGSTNPRQVRAAIVRWRRRLHARL